MVLVGTPAPWAFAQRKRKPVKEWGGGNVPAMVLADTPTPWAYAQGKRNL